MNLKHNLSFLLYIQVIFISTFSPKHTLCSNPLYTFFPFIKIKDLTMGKLEVEVETKSSPDKLWGTIKETPTLFPKIFPDRYKSVEVLEGDGASVGSVLLMKYHETTPGVTFSKERIDEADNANKSLAYTVIEGEILALYPTFNAKLQVVPKGDGSLVKWSLEYEKASEEVPEPTFIKEFATQTFTGLDAHIQKA
ncbi:hypothetical protein AQUCO_02500250v1 [Aquilegia coerulea]|uniref:Bet v I/Major latex protein domain-containing protein n=1 Tax=Aquilegia coerulea TaxID=218851 RepID=A0A2G5DB14_AQUCA|nr:hypothetical protein AQUCO_02500250v1 [Aquilegia coerulea]